MKYLPYILKHLRRNWIRTLSTVAGMAVCIFLICTLQAVMQAIQMDLQNASPSRLVTRHNVSLVFNMPVSYKPRIEAVPGVKSVAASNWFGGVRGSVTSGDSFKDFFPNMAVEAEPYFAMYPEFMVPSDQMQAFLQDMRGCVVGRETANKFGWKVGSTFQLESFIPPYRVGRPFEFTIRAIYDSDPRRYPGTNLTIMFFHYKYLYESTSQRAGVGTYMVEVANPTQGAAVGRVIDQLFENSDVQTKTESERAFREGFAAMVGNLALLLNSIGLAVSFTILLVTANTMSMAVRERRTEIAVLKTLGFPSGLVMLLVLAEALVLGALGGAIGVLLGGALIANVAKVPYLGLALGNFPALELSVRVAVIAFGTATLLGLLAGAMPAWGTYRAKITDMLRAA